MREPKARRKDDARTEREKGTGMSRMRKAVSSVVIMAALLMTVGVAAAPSAQALSDRDHFQFWDWSGSRAWVQGDIDWSYGLRTSGIFRNTYSYIGRAGCIWVRINWNFVNATVSWPPSGTVGSTSDGWMRKCYSGAGWTALTFNGVNYPASFTLLSATVMVGYSTLTNPGLRLYVSAKKMLAGFG